MDSMRKTRLWRIGFSVSLGGAAVSVVVLAFLPSIGRTNVEPLECEDVLLENTCGNRTQHARSWTGWWCFQTTTVIEREAVVDNATGRITCQPVNETETEERIPPPFWEECPEGQTVTIRSHINHDPEEPFEFCPPITVVDREQIPGSYEIPVCLRLCDVEKYEWRWYPNIGRVCEFLGIQREEQIELGPCPDLVDDLLDTGLPGGPGPIGPTGLQP